MPSNRKLKLHARRQARQDADLRKRLDQICIGEGGRCPHKCGYCHDRGHAPGADDRTPCGFCGSDRCDR